MNAAAWLALMCPPVGALLESGQSSGVKLAGSIGLALVAVCLAVRGYRAGASYGPDGIVVRGFFATRRIPKARIVAITELPAVRWTRADGKARWSPIFAFWTGDQRVPFVVRHNDEMIQLLQNWADRQRLAARRNPAKKRRQRPAR